MEKNYSFKISVKDRILSLDIIYPGGGDTSIFYKKLSDTEAVPTQMTLRKKDFTDAEIQSVTSDLDIDDVCIYLNVGKEYETDDDSFAAKLQNYKNYLFQTVKRTDGIAIVYSDQNLRKNFIPYEADVLFMQDQGVEKFQYKTTFDGKLHTIATAAHNCFQVEKGNDTSTDLQFCEHLLALHHYSPFEFAAINIPTPMFREQIHRGPGKFWESETVTLVTYRYLIETCHYSLTAIAKLENQLPERPCNKNLQIYRIVTDRATMTQIVRQRSLSFCVESQIYCSYKTNVVYINQEGMDNYVLYKSILNSENAYHELIDEGNPGMVARLVLPNCARSIMYVAGCEKDINTFIYERLNLYTKKVIHPISVIAEKMQAADKNVLYK